MINTTRLLKKINNLPQDNTLYLLEKLPCGTGLFASNNNLLYIVPNDEHCKFTNIKTDFLRLETNIYITAFNLSVSSFENGYYNSVELKLSDLNDIESNISAFVNLCLAHATYMEGSEFVSFFDSLVSLFQLPKEQHYKNLVGLMGELLFIEYVHINYGLDISPYWHTNGSFSRLDFVCQFANFEVKATTNESLRFLIKHEQLFTNSEKTYLVAVVIEENNIGRTLKDIIIQLQGNTTFCNNLNFAINIEKEKRKISPTDINCKRFVLKKIHVYSAHDINPFSTVPDNVEELSYKLDLLPYSNVSFESLFS